MEYFISLRAADYTWSCRHLSFSRPPLLHSISLTVLSSAMTILLGRNIELALRFDIYENVFRMKNDSVHTTTTAMALARVSSEFKNPEEFRKRVHPSTHYGMEKDQAIFRQIYG